MRLEHRKEKLATIPIFLKRILRYFLFSSALIAFSTGIGTIGYRFIGGLNWIDGFHMACMILTGMGPVAEMHTNEAKLFSSFYALYSGVAFLSVTAVLFAPFVHRLLHILHVEQEKSEE